ncbi:uncharacterized protein METZ01_LOCUS413517, partial [marine metagenome]
IQHTWLNFHQNQQKVDMLSHLTQMVRESV